MLLSAPAFPYPSFEQIALDGALEQLFGHRHHDAAECLAVVRLPDIAESRHTSVTPLGKKLFDAGLAAQSFFFGKSIGALCVVHFQSFDR